jgi:hypothetical protein
MPSDPNGQEVAEEIQPVELSTTEQTTEVKSELPEDASDRTKEQFTKLTEHNKQLKEENERLKAQGVQIPETSVFDAIRGPQVETPVVTPPPAFNFPGLTQNQVNDTFSNLVDKDGYIDEKILKSTLSELQKAAQAAKEESANLRREYEKREENEQVRATHKKYPQLDPKSSNFDPKFFERVKKELIIQFVNGKRDFLGAADTIAEDYPLKPIEKKEDTQKKQDQVRQINAIGSSVSRSSAPDLSHEDEADLVKRTQRGDTSALMERLKRAGL